MLQVTMSVLSNRPTRLVVFVIIALGKEKGRVSERASEWERFNVASKGVRYHCEKCSLPKR